MIHHSLQHLLFRWSSRLIQSITPSSASGELPQRLAGITASFAFDVALARTDAMEERQ
ncbi:hypothetical protein [Rosistilla oblonga]|uniref:hypothetical protein n=1 Tax=Rosistilla oblonga TaxID=2527990 RepID=UPI003A96C424